MGIIRKYNKESEQWEVVSTSEASTISVRSEKLLPEGQSQTNVEEVLLGMKDDISTMKGNISWLALHGGGGSGGSGGTGITGDILVNGYTTGSQIIFNSNEGLNIQVQASLSNLKWNITAVNNDKVIKSISNSTKLTISKQDIDDANISGTFQLAITAFNNDTLTNLYWNGTIFVASVDLSTVDISHTFEGYEDYELQYNYKIGVTGSYSLYVNDKVVWNGALTTLEGNINIRIGDIEGLSVGSNKIISRLLQVENPDIKSDDFTSFITLTADVPIITCTTLSTDEEHPTEVPINKDTNTVVLMPYTVYFTSGTYKARIYSNKDSQPPSFDTITTFNSYNVTYNNASYVLLSDEYEEKVTITISIQDSNTNLEYTQNYYIITKSPTYGVLDNGLSEYLIFDYTTYEGAIKNKQWSDRNTTLTISNTNYYSEDIQTSDRSLRLLNASYATITTNPGFNDFYTQLTNSNIWSFTLSICYKADFHPDDDRVILQFGDLYDESAGYTPKSGIVVRDHKLYVGLNTLDLQDNELIDLTISYSHTGVDAAGVFGNAFVYIDGVLEAVFNIKRTDIIPNVPNIYIGAQVYDDESMFYTDVNIYRVALYKTCLNPYHILFDYLNNQARTHLLSDGTFDSSYIENGLKRNFISVDEESNKTSLLWDVTSNFNNNDSDFSDCFTLNNLISISGNDVSFRDDLNTASFSIPIPMMLIDVSHDTSWTWKNFITPDSALRQVDECRFQYFDLTQSNSSIITGNVSVSLQGTSTLADFVKNLNITFADDAVFIPKDTWFPEKVYTLKADIVDSSHSLNTSIGKFVNTEFGLQYKEDGSLKDTESWYPYSETVLNTFAELKSNKESAISKYFPKATLKHGIEGFPIFLIMRFNTGGDPDAKSIATLGIYQFILGRDSARNLGYSIITNVTGMDEASAITYPYYKNEGVTLTSNDNKGYWIEMTQNDSFDDSTHFLEMNTTEFKEAKLTGAFWQNDNNGSYYNSAAEVKYTNLGAEAETDLNKLLVFKDFVNTVLQLPVTNRRYSVEKLETLARNTFSNITYPKYEYINDGSSFSWKLVSGENNTLVAEGDELQGLLSKLNIDSISKYFVIAMFLGLIDNFQKNMPIKIYRNSDGDWENPILGIYDTDTGCGGTNEGDIKVSEDVWLCPIINSGQQMLESSTKENDNKVHQIIGNSNKLWYLDSSQLNYSYLSTRNGSIFSGEWNSFLQFFMTKYISSDTPVSDLTDLANLYIDKYFIPLTEGCGEILFNLTYFSKYLNKYTLSGSDTPVNQYTKLHGRRKYQIRNWLKNRVRFLDSMFCAMGTPDKKYLPIQLTPSTVNISSGSAPLFYIKTNYPVISSVNSLGSMNKFVFCDKNVDTEIYWGSSSNNSSPVSHTISYSDAIQRLGNDYSKLSDIKYLKIISGSLPYLTTFDVSGCDMIEAMNADGMNSFKVNNTSLLREINCLNTAKTGSTINFVLNLISGFLKLQSIDIYNSCVSLLELPLDPNIPLLHFNIVGAQLTSLDLNTQNLLETIDITNCNKLTSLNITNCEKLTNVTLDSTLSALSTVTINSSTFTDFKCTENDSVKSISINSDQLKSVVIQNCNKLLSVTVNGKKLDILDLHGCINLSTLNIISPKDNIQKLDLYGTNLRTIQYNGQDNEEGIFDLTPYRSFETLVLGGNQSIEYVLFLNEEDNPIILNSNFQGCTNLKRVYGNIQLKTSGMFYTCKKFSIHGTDLSTLLYNGQSVLDGSRVKHPLEISGITSNGKMVFQPGLKVTNLTFISSNADRDFSSTDCTLFDIYYAMYNIGSATSCTGMFEGLTTSKFEWTEEADNSPNRNLFINCGNVTSLSEFMEFGSSTDGSTPNIRLFSPSHDEDGTVTANDGLFSPLVNCTNISWLLGSHVAYCDRYLFRRVDDQYKFNQVLSFGCRLVVDDINKLNPSDIVDGSALLQYMVSNYSTIGNFNGFFRNLNNLTGLYSFFNGTQMFNYTLSCADEGFKIPRKVTNLTASFCSTYATGDIIPENLFTLDSGVVNIEYIYNSFVHSTAIPSQLSSLMSNATLRINSDMLAKFTKLKALGFETTGNWSGTYTKSSFGGDGVEKTIDLSTFPYDILKGCKDTIELFAGFFLNVKPSSVNDILLPGTLFLGCSKLSDITALFNNFQNDFSLTSEGFATCTNILKMPYLFMNNNGHLIGSIPKKFFYHGEYTVTNTYTGADLWDEELGDLKYNPLEITGYDEETGLPIYRGVDPEDIQDPKTITYKQPKTNITDIQYCFHSSNTSAYTNSNPTVENNEDYMPFTHILQNGKWISVVRNMNEKSFIWEYDGVNKPADYVGENLDDVHQEDILPEVKIFDSTDTGTLNYAFPPDLLRYCKNSGDTKINHLFSNSGHDTHTLSHTNYPNNATFGIKGRICPYMLKPVSNIKSISNMFRDCKQLSYYTDESNNTYTIPKSFFSYTPYLTDLSRAFQGIVFHKGAYLDVFKIGANVYQSLDVSYIFYRIWFKVDEADRINVGAIFGKPMTINKLEYAFSVNEENKPSVGNVPIFTVRNQYVTFDKVFETIGKNQDTYVFDGYDKSTVKFLNKTLRTNSIYNNYRYSDNSYAE